MQKDRDEEIERLLRWEAERPVPIPSAHLVPDTIRRVRVWLLMGDLLRLATVEVLWKSLSRESGDANETRARQDP